MNAIRALLLVFCIAAGPSAAQDIMLARSPSDFETTLARVQRSIADRGYSVAHVQRCDLGLEHMGYDTDRYRVVFFGRLDEVRELLSDRVELAPFLPLRVAVFAEDDETIVAAIDPVALTAHFPDREIAIQLGRWKRDLRGVLDEAAGFD